MGYKPSVFEQAKFDYSALGNFVNKGLQEGDKKKLLRILQMSALFSDVLISTRKDGFTLFV